MKLNKTIWFWNDADGMSMIDVLSICTFFAWLIFKVAHLSLSIIFKDYPNLLIQINLIMEDISEFMNVIILFYFGKKTLDTTVTKVGLLATKQYKVPDFENDEITKNSSTDNNPVG